MSPPATTTDIGEKRKKKAAKPKDEKPNGKAANGVTEAMNGHATEPAFPESPDATSQEAAADDDAPEAVEAFVPPEPTQKDLDYAAEVFRKLDADAEGMGDREVVDALLQLVEVHKQFVTPLELFQGRDSDEPQFDVASVVGEIARMLCRGCSKIDAPHSRIGFVFKDHEKWTSAGQTVDAVVKRFDGFQQYMNDGMVAAVIVNYHHWKTLTPLQRVFLTYHALREIDGDGKRRGADWTGYFEEPGLFGSGVHREMVTMARAFVKDAPERSAMPYQLSILDEVYDGA